MDEADVDWGGDPLLEEEAARVPEPLEPPPPHKAAPTGRNAATAALLRTLGMAPVVLNPSTVGLPPWPRPPQGPPLQAPSSPMPLAAPPRARASSLPDRFPPVPAYPWTSPAKLTAGLGAIGVAHKPAEWLAAKAKPLWIAKAHQVHETIHKRHIAKANPDVYIKRPTPGIPPAPPQLYGCEDLMAHHNYRWSKYSKMAAHFRPERNSCMINGRPMQALYQRLHTRWAHPLARVYLLVATSFRDTYL